MVQETRTSKCLASAEPLMRVFLLNVKETIPRRDDEASWKPLAFAAMSFLRKIFKPMVD